MSRYSRGSRLSLHLVVWTVVIMLGFGIGLARPQSAPHIVEHGIVAWGDSLTAGAGASGGAHAYPAVASTLFSPPRTIVSKGIGGQGASQIAARQGGVAILVTPSDNEIGGNGVLYTWAYGFSSAEAGWNQMGAGAFATTGGAAIRSGMTTYLEGLKLNLPEDVPSGYTVEASGSMSVFNIPGTELKYGPMAGGTDTSGGAWVPAGLATYINSGNSASFSDSWVTNATATHVSILTRNAPSSVADFALDNITVTVRYAYAGDPVSAKSVNVLQASGVYAGTSVGTLAGTPGVMSTDASGNWTFTRSDTGAPVSCPANTPFVPDDAQVYRDHIAWIWAGNNGISSSTTVDQALAAIAAMVGHLGHSRFLVAGTLTRDTDTPGVIAERLSLNSQLAAAYGARYIDLYSLLRANGDGSPEDTADIAAGYIPRSLRSDAVHLNDAGYALVAAAMHAATVARGW